MEPLKSPLFEIRVATQFEAAHNLRLYKGAVEPLHGHSWKVEIFLKAPLNPEGYAIDFVELKQKLDSLSAPFEHHYLNEVSPFDEITPTAEQLSSWFFDQMAMFVSERGGKLSKVVVWEGPECSAACESKL